MSTELGGILMLLTKTMSFVSMFNFAMITRLQYYSPEDDYIRTIFPHYGYFLMIVCIGVIIIMLIIYIFVIPSEIIFNNHQSIKDNRNPLYDLLEEVNIGIQELKEEVETIKKNIKEE